MAGSSSNWFKISHGPKKGQRVFVSNATIAQGYLNPRRVKGIFHEDLAGKGSAAASKNIISLSKKSVQPGGKAQKGGAVTAKATAATTERQNTKAQAHNLALRLSETEARLRMETNKDKRQELSSYANTLRGIVQKNVSDGDLPASMFEPKTKQQFTNYSRARGVTVRYLKPPTNVTEKVGIETPTMQVRVSRKGRTVVQNVGPQNLRRLIDDVAFGPAGGKPYRRADPFFKGMVSAGE